MTIKLSYFGSPRFRKCEIKQIIGLSFGEKVWLKLELAKYYTKNSFLTYIYIKKQAYGEGLGSVMPVLVAISVHAPIFPIPIPYPFKAYFHHPLEFK